MQCYYNVKSKDKEQNKKPVAELTTKRQAPNKNNMEGAYIITYVGKGVNHEKIKL